MKHWIALLLSLAACQTIDDSSDSKASLRPARLRCEHKLDGLGIGTTQPHLDWIVEARDSDARGLSQSAYRILAATSADLLARDVGDLWDSGKIETDRTTDVEYAGAPLRVFSNVHWKLRVWDQDDRASEWSEPAFFSVGPLERSDWQAQAIGWDAPLASLDRRPDLGRAQWIWFAGEDPLDAPEGERGLRVRFTIPRSIEVREARLLIAVDNFCEVFLDGESIGGNPDELDHWRHGLHFDLSGKLKSGEHVIAIDARNAAQGAAGVIGVLHVNPGAPDAWVGTTGDAWRASDRLEPGWTAPGFDDSRWPAAKVIGAHGIEPWGAVAARGLVLPPPIYLRKEFAVDKGVRRALLYATALGLYELELNGQRVGDQFFAPGWTDYPTRVAYQTYDVTALVRRGQNALGAMLADGWYAGYVGYGGRRYHYGKKTRVFAMLAVEHADGSRTVVGTDGSWKASTGPLREADFLMGERYDATLELPGWSKPGFDDRAWARVEGGVQERPLIEPHRGDPVRAFAVLEPISTREVAPDVFVLDLGQNIAGFARIAVRGERGQRITLRYAERLDADGHIYTSNLRGARATDVYVCKGEGLETWQPRFTFHGFQYVEVSGLGAPPEPGAVLGVALSSDTPMVAQFETSDALADKLYENTWWTQRMNFIDVPTDCPQRDERLGWTGDAQAYIRTACFLADAQAFYTKWLVDLMDAQRADGQFPMVAPLKVAGADGGPAWADAGVICPWAIYQVYGDRDLLRRCYEPMARFVAFCEGRSVNYLPPAEFHCFGDWLNIDAPTPNEVIYTAYFAHAASILERSARVFGKEDDERRYGELFENVRRAFVEAYVDADGRVKGDSQTGYVLALAFDLLEGEQREQAIAHLIANIKARAWHLSTGFVGTKDLMLVLTRVGRTDVAYRLLANRTFPSWGFTIDNGATSIWERWDGWTPDKGFQDPGMNSFAHYAFGAVTQWMFETIGGIRPSAPGFQEIVIRPEPGGDLEWARVCYDSIRGRIRTRWQLFGDELELKVLIPPNTTAKVVVPTTDLGSVRESGRPAGSSPGVKYLRAEPEGAVFEVGSGRYVFTCREPIVRRLAP